MAETPILWSFRRCPYAMRARLAIATSGIQVELREILLRDKPQAFLDISPKGTVPVLAIGSTVIAESRDIMHWVLSKNDPLGWLDMPDDGHTLIDTNDGPFKEALDHTKYAVHFPDLDIADERAKAMTFLSHLNHRLTTTPYLTGSDPKLADMAILPFVRQFANTDRTWFDQQELEPLTHWLETFLTSDQFAGIMRKYPAWQNGQDQVFFPDTHQ